MELESDAAQTDEEVEVVGSIPTATSLDTIYFMGNEKYSAVNGGLTIAT